MYRMRMAGCLPLVELHYEYRVCYNGLASPTQKCGKEVRKTRVLQGTVSGESQTLA